MVRMPWKRRSKMYFLAFFEKYVILLRRTIYLEVVICSSRCVRWVTLEVLFSSHAIWRKNSCRIKRYCRSKIMVRSYFIKMERNGSIKMKAFAQSPFLRTQWSYYNSYTNNIYNGLIWLHKGYFIYIYRSSIYFLQYRWYTNRFS